MRKPFYILGPDGQAIPLASGEKCHVILPAAKGDKYSFLLTEGGRMVLFSGTRIDGVGVERYAKQRGFVPATGKEMGVLRLQKLVAIHLAVHAVQSAGYERAKALQAELAGMEISYVPFDPEQPIKRAKVRASMSSTIAVGIGSGFSAGMVATEWSSDPQHLSGGASLADGWLVADPADIAVSPRNCDYGGIIEKAAFVLVNCGLARFGEQRHLEMQERETDDPRSSRGKLTLILSDGGTLTIGIMLQR